MARFVTICGRTHRSPRARGRASSRARCEARSEGSLSCRAVISVQASLALSDGDAVGALLSAALWNSARGGHGVHHARVRSSYSRCEAARYHGAYRFRATDLTLWLMRVICRRRSFRHCFELSTPQALPPLAFGPFIDLKEPIFLNSIASRAIWALRRASLRAGGHFLPAYRAFYLNEEANLERDRSFQIYRRFKAVNRGRLCCAANACRGAQAVSGVGLPLAFGALRCRFQGAFWPMRWGLGKSLQLISFFWPAMPSASRIRALSCARRRLCTTGRPSSSDSRPSFPWSPWRVVRKSAELRASRHSAAIDALTCWSPHMICFASISTIGRAAACSYVRSTRRNISKTPRRSRRAR